MQSAAPQDSRTHLHVATHTEKIGSTWAFSCREEDLPSSDESLTDQSHHAYFKSHTTPSEAILRRVCRQALFETQIRPRLHTEKGRDTMVLRWYGIPEDVPSEEQSERLAKELEADDAAIEEVVVWSKGHLPESRGRSLSLLAPVPEPRRWQGEHLWVTGVLDDQEFLAHRRVQRVGRQHLWVILRAISSFADRGSGWNVTASNQTIANKAAKLCAEHIADGGGWRGRRTDELSAVTLKGLISATVTALSDSGWLRERARGRHLNLLERAVAWLRHGLFQTKAASVRDLIVPDRARRHRSGAADQPHAPAWASANNPFIVEGVANKLWITLKSVVATPLLHTHQCGALLVLLVILNRWLLKKKASESQPRRKKRRRTLPRPSFKAQKLAAQLIDRLPWLLRSPKPGKRRHSHELARVLDAEQVTGLKAAEIITHMEVILATHRWEIHPETIRAPLGWFRTVLRNGWGTSRQPRTD